VRGLIVERDAARPVDDTQAEAGQQRSGGAGDGLCVDRSVDLAGDAERLADRHANAIELGQIDATLLQRLDRLVGAWLRHHRLEDVELVQVHVRVAARLVADTREQQRRRAGRRRRDRSRWRRPARGYHNQQPHE
jgi:hypothetical protein